MWDGKYTFKVFDAQKNNDLIFPDEEGSSPEEFIPKGCEVCCVIQCGGIYVADGKFGVTWKLYQASVKKPEKLEDNKCYVKMIDTLTQSEGEDQEVKLSQKLQKTDIYESDGEDEMSASASVQPSPPKEEEEPKVEEENVVEEAPKAPVKKSVKGKKV
jgi:hypothetical protein